MADRQRLTDGTTTIVVNPLVNPAYNRPDSRDRGIFRSRDGTAQQWDAGGAQLHDVAVNDVSKTNADKINTWMASRTILTYTPDLSGASGTTIYTRIVNIQKPMQMMFDTGFQSKYEGQLVIQEVSSSSSAGE